MMQGKKCGKGCACKRHFGTFSPQALERSKEVRRLNGYARRTCPEGCPCGRHSGIQKCSETCTCKRHTHPGYTCPPDCSCGRHTNRFTKEAQTRGTQASVAVSKGRSDPDGSQKLKLFWSDPDNKARMLHAQRTGMKQTPLPLELALLDKLGCDWQYVGDGSVWVGWYNPDFQCVSNPSLFIDLFGDYWHRGVDPAKRIAYFRRKGKTLIVLWEKEVRAMIDMKVYARIRKERRVRKSSLVG